jgi:hypothetical protein
MNQQIQSKDLNATVSVTPDAIMQLGFAFWGSKTLLSAVELGLFTLLGDKPLSADALTTRLKLHPRSVRATSSMRWCRSDYWNATMASIPTRRLARCFSIAVNQPMSAECSKWRTHGSIHSGAV